MIVSSIQHFETNKIRLFGNVLIERLTSFMYFGMTLMMVRSCMATFNKNVPRDGFSKQN